MPGRTSSIDRSVLDALAADIRRGDFGNTHALLVAHRGVLQYEAYFRGDDRTWGEGAGSGWEAGWERGVDFGPQRLHDARSVTKTVVAMLVGIAIEQGHIASPDARIADLLPRYRHLLDGRKRELTVRHLLTMTPGLEWTEANAGLGDDEQRMYASADPTAFVLGRPLVADPGTQFTYGGGTTHVLAAILEASTGVPLEQYAREQLFAPLGIDTYEWRGDVGGMPAAASGLRLLPREFAKLGLLFEDEGRWHDRQLVPAAWVRETMSAQVDVPVAPDAPDGTLRSGYGFQMWNDAYLTALGPTAVSAASGLGGQRIFVVPRHDLVVVVLSGHFGKRGMGWTPERIFIRVANALAPATARDAAARGEGMR